MKNALISPTEQVLTGYRVAEVSDTAFEVAPPLFWVECADDVIADEFYYDEATHAIIAVPVKPTPLLNPDVTNITGDAPNVIA
jgi:hypothetical protein